MERQRSGNKMAKKKLIISKKDKKNISFNNFVNKIL